MKSNVYKIEESWNSIRTMINDPNAFTSKFAHVFVYFYMRCDLHFIEFKHGLTLIGFARKCRFHSNKGAFFKMRK